MNLHAIQTDFQRLVLNAECEGADWVRESAQDLSPRQRIGIYHNAYRIRLIDVLLDTFEHTSIYLGDEWFRQLAADYVQSHHSTYNNIGHYGRDFPGFLARQLADDLDVSELALMDWELRRAFDGPDSSLLNQAGLEQLATATDGDLRLRPVPTLTIIQQHFNTLDIWHAIDQEQIPPGAQRLQAPVDILITLSSWQDLINIPHNNRLFG